MKKLTAIAGLVALLITPVASAAVSDEEFQEVKRMLEQALDRISELERRDEQIAVAPAGAATAEQVVANTATLEKMSWAERIRFEGDFRYRYQPEEAKKLLDNANMPADNFSRNRQRIRARAALIADLSDNIEVGLGIATGGDDPVSSNQTLGGAGSSKGLNLDLAYVDWGFTNGGNIAAGKFKNHFVDIAKSGFLWDADWRPEGIDMRYEHGAFYVAGLGTWLEADSSQSSSFNYGVQAGFKPQVGDTRLNIGAGYTKIKAEGLDCYNSPSDGRGSDCVGNTYTTRIDGDGDELKVYVMDYTPVQLYAKADFATAIPFGVFADFVRNVDAKTITGGPSSGKKLDSAYLAGLQLGRGKKQGDWQVKTYYQEKEADSMPGLLTDSDFAGGGTDSKGYVVKGRYMLTNRAYFQATYLHGERQDSNGNENGSSTTSNPFDVNIWQLDLQFKYK
jgi:hypothetical protein